MKNIATLIIIASVFLAGCVSTSQNEFGTTSFSNRKNTVNISALGELEIGKITIVNDPAISKYAFIYYIPPTALNVELVKTVMIGNGLMRVPYQEVVDMVEGNFYNRYKQYSDQYGYVLLTVVTPGDAQVMNRDSMIPGEIKDSFVKRPDLEYRRVIEAFTNSIETMGYDAHDKVFMTGFSNGGTQSNVFSVIHPDKVEATAIGGCGGYLRPVSKAKGMTLEWPRGFADISKIKDITFTPELLKEVETFIFIGEDDTNPNNDILFHPGWKPYKAKFGTTTVARVETYADYLVEYGVDAEYEIYPDTGHQFTPPMLTDLFEFFDSIPVQ